MTKEQIEILKNWGPNQSPIRAYRWAQFMRPMEEPETWEGMTVEQIRAINKRTKTYRLVYSGNDSHIAGWSKYLHTNYKKYWQFLKDHNLEPTGYDRFMGKYDEWLRTEAVSPRN